MRKGRANEKWFLACDYFVVCFYCFRHHLLLGGCSMKTLVVTAHFDDAEISAGGTIAKYGADIMPMFPRPGSIPEGTGAAEVLGATIVPLSYETEDDRRGLVDLLTGKYDRIISVSPYDSHPDHQKAASIARQIARKNTADLWFMDHAIPGGVAGSAPTPSLYVDTSDTYRQKEEAIKCYESQIAKYGEEWLEQIHTRDWYNALVLGGDTTAAERFHVEHMILRRDE